MVKLLEFRHSLDCKWAYLKIQYKGNIKNIDIKAQDGWRLADKINNLLIYLSQ